MKSLFFLLVLIFVATVYSQERYINVNGTAELNINANQINFSVQLKVIKGTIKESNEANDKYVNQLLQMLKETGINSDDIEVSPITLGKNFEFGGGERKQNGFFAQVNISFLLKDLSKYYDLTNKLASNDNFEVTSSSYEISDYEAQHKKAYEQALLAAKQKAEYMCSTMQVSLGEVLEIDASENPQLYPQPFNVMSRENNENENPFGKVTINRTVKVKFAIK